MSHNLNSLKGGYIGIISGTTMGILGVQTIAQIIPGPSLPCIMIV